LPPTPRQIFGTISNKIVETSGRIVGRVESWVDTINQSIIVYGNEEIHS